MNLTLLMLASRFCALLAREDGQDLVEYALLCALISLAAVAGLNGLAGSISSVFATVSTSLTAA